MNVNDNHVKNNLLYSVFYYSKNKLIIFSILLFKKPSPWIQQKKQHLTNMNSKLLSCFKRCQFSSQFQTKPSCTTFLCNVYTCMRFECSFLRSLCPSLPHLALPLILSCFVYFLNNFLLHVTQQKSFHSPPLIYFMWYRGVAFGFHATLSCAVACIDCCEENGTAFYCFAFSSLCGGDVKFDLVIQRSLIAFH
jgi:hypothetical protein